MNRYGMPPKLWAWYLGKEQEKAIAIDKLLPKKYDAGTIHHVIEGAGMIIKNAVITGTTLEIKNGFLTAWLTLDYGGSGQEFGGTVLYLPPSYKHHTKASIAGHFITRCMEVAGVKEWGDLVGKPVRVKFDQIRVKAIGHIIKDDWFDPQDDFTPQITTEAVG